MDTIKRVGNLFSHEELPEETFECPEHGAYTGKPCKLTISGRERVVDPECPLCSPERAEEKAREEAAWQEQQKTEFDAEQETKLKRMNIGRKFWDVSFETFKAYTPDLERHLDTCIKFVGNSEGRMLLMLGKNGNGKNHLAASILKKTGGRMYSVFEIELMLKECYSGKTGESKLYRRLCNIPVLVINEIGKHKVGEWETHFLSYIINKRYENLMPTVLISNAHLKANCPQNGCDNCLQNLLGNDVLSRITESGDIMIFNEADYRLRKREIRQ